MGAIYQWYRQLLRSPRSRLLVVLGTLMYLLSPIDVAPDLIPFLGQLDDVVLLTLLLTEVFQWFSDRLQLQPEQDTPAHAENKSSGLVIDVKAIEVDPDAPE